MTFQNFWIDGGELAKSESASSKIERELAVGENALSRERDCGPSSIGATDRWLFPSLGTIHNGRPRQGGGGSARKQTYIVWEVV